MTRQYRLGAATVLLLLAHALLTSASSAQGRIDRDLVALYRFGSVERGSIANAAKGKGDLTLKAGKLKSANDAVLVGKDSRLQTEGPAQAVIDGCRASNELTIEAWLKPDNTKQSGPARIVSISKDTSNRNITLGQDGDKFDVRLRTTKTSGNGLPSVSTNPGVVQTERTHVVYTRSRDGRAVIYVNGKEVKSQTIDGNLSNWDMSYRLSIANEVSGDRPWLGELSLVAIYSRALKSDEVRSNFDAGPQGEVSPEVLAQREHAAKAAFFETKVAPLLADRCVECHDATTSEGSLNLAHKGKAFQGGDSGVVIRPGQPDDSLLWTSVDSNHMPHERDPLSKEQKAVLKQWIADGAVWSLEAIDPAVYEFADITDPVIQRLTVDEYIETVRAATGVDIEAEARELLPKDLRADGFNNTAYNLTVDLKHVQSYATLAETIVNRLDVPQFAKRFTNKRGVNDNDSRELVEKMGRWLFRGPLERHEIDNYRGIVTTVVSAGGDFDEATRYVIEAMLQSPRFIYRVERTKGQPTQYELASRLSYIVWGGPPDEELFRLAEQGKLDRGESARQLDRMLKDPRAKEKSRQFVSQWLNLGRLASMQPNKEKYPNWTPDLAADMEAETLAVFDEVVWKQNRPLSDLLNAQVTFVTPKLSKHYGFKVDAASGSETIRVDLTKVPERGGILTHGSVLTVGGDEASMVTRGLFVMRDLLRGVVKDPPPCVNTTPVPTKAGLTQRKIAQDRIKNVACGGCHAKFEPLAFGLEKFDGLGAFHNKDEHGNELRNDGEVLIPGAAEAVPFGNSAELMKLLAGSERVRETLTWKVTQFSLGRPLGASDAPVVAAIAKSANDNGFTYPSLLKAIILSDLVQR